MLARTKVMLVVSIGFDVLLVMTIAFAPFLIMRSPGIEVFSSGVPWGPPITPIRGISADGGLVPVCLGAIGILAGCWSLGRRQLARVRMGIRAAITANALAAAFLLAFSVGFSTPTLIGHSTETSERVHTMVMALGYGVTVAAAAACLAVGSGFSALCAEQVTIVDSNFRVGGQTTGNGS